MKKFFFVSFSVIAAVIISAFLAPLLHQFLPFKFEKILNRLLIISAFIICFSFVRIDKSFLKECGFFSGSKLKMWGTGFVVSFLILASLILIEFGLGALTFSESFHFSLPLIFMSLATGFTVGFIEEFFFRGFLFLKLRPISSARISILLTSAIYSAVHFLKSGRPLIEGAPSMWDSFRVLGSSAAAFFKWGEIWPAFVGLFLFGIVLNIAFIRTRSLFLPMGLHAGAVFLLKLVSRWYQVDPDASTLFYGGRGFYSGVLGWVFILAIGAVIYGISSLTSAGKRR